MTQKGVTHRKLSKRPIDVQNREERYREPTKTKNAASAIQSLKIDLNNLTLTNYKHIGCHVNNKNIWKSKPEISYRHCQVVNSVCCTHYKILYNHVVTYMFTRLMNEITRTAKATTNPIKTARKITTSIIMEAVLENWMKL